MSTVCALTVGHIHVAFLAFQMRLNFLVFLLLGGEALGSGLDSAAESAQSFSDSSRGFLSSFSGGEV